MIPGLNVRDEELLLCSLCRKAFDGVNIKDLRSLSGKINDWNYFSELAGAHGIAALVYNNMSSLDLLCLIPQEIKEILRSSLLKNIARNAGLIEKTSGVLEILNSHYIKTVLLKGLALEMSVYGNAGLRQMTDVDILVRREDSIKTRKILMENGFVSHPVKSVLYKPILAYAGKHLPTLTKDGFAIEIHNELFGKKNSFLTKKLFDDSHEAELKGMKTFIPGPFMFFLYLVKHLALHEMNNESQLRLYTDLIVLIEQHRDEIFDNSMTELALKADLHVMLASHLRPLRDFCGISFPDLLNDFIDRWSGPESTDKFLFFLKSPKNNPQTNRSELYRYHISEIPGFHRKLLFILGDLFPTMEFMKKRYGCTSNLRTLIYYPLRWGKLWNLIN